MERLYYDSARCGETPVRYYLLSETGDRREYGLAVEMADEETSLPALAVSRREVQDLLGRMVRGIVTPVTAGDIVYDWLVGRQMAEPSV